MSKLPSLTGKEIVSLLKKAGFAMERQRGSHVFLRHKDGRATVVPILRDVEMTKDELLKILEQ